MNKKLMLSLIATLMATSAYTLPAVSDVIVIFGASGQFGSHLVREALDRGHQVVGVSRSPEKFQYSEPNFKAVKGNPTEIDSVQTMIKDADAIVVALGDRVAATPETTAMNLTAIALSTVLDNQGTQGPPVIILGGGNTSAKNTEGMLEILASRAVNGEVSPQIRQIFLSQWATLQTYSASNINWTYVATPRNILGLRGGDPARTGKYRVATDGSLDREANTGLSRADIAVAMIDFAESAEYNQKRLVIAQETAN